MADFKFSPDAVEVNFPATWMGNEPNNIFLPARDRNSNIRNCLEMPVSLVFPWDWFRVTTQSPRNVEDLKQRLARTFSEWMEA